jgi:hypothetical protein
VHKHLDEVNYQETMTAVAGKTKLQVLEILARRAPKADVPDRIIPLTSEPLMAFTPPAPALSQMATPTAQMTPLAEARYAFELTIDAALRTKLERAADLMRHANPTGDLATVLDRALDVLVKKLEKQRLGKTSRPSTAPRGKATRITRALRRAVFERDGERCTFHDEEGHRCPAITLLEIDHVIPRASGGKNELPNLRVRCRSHNRLHAEKSFGREHVDRKIAEHRSQERRIPESFELASRGLVNSGFRHAEVKRAIDVLLERHAADAKIPPATIVVEALAILT